MKHRHIFSLSLLVLVAACATDFKPLKFPDPVPLVTPGEGMAVVYLMRTPHDSAQVDVFLNGTRTATLPRETYAVLMLKPGAYKLIASEPNPSYEAAQATLTLSVGERRFIYTSEPSSRRIWPAFVPVVGAIMLLIEPNSSDGARSWTECSEMDAQGLFAILTAVTPERNAP
jgi:hypothetical protein